MTFILIVLTPVQL